MRRIGFRGNWSTGMTALVIVVLLTLFVVIPVLVHEAEGSRRTVGTAAAGTAR